jgi:hypothetical protein
VSWYFIFNVKSCPTSHAPRIPSTWSKQQTSQVKAKSPGCPRPSTQMPAASLGLWNFWPGGVSRGPHHLFLGLDNLTEWITELRDLPFCYKRQDVRYRKAWSRGASVSLELRLQVRECVHQPGSFPTLTFLYVELDFEFRASHLQSRCSTTWVTLPVRFCSVYFWWRSLGNYLPGLDLNLDPSDLSFPRS